MGAEVGGGGFFPETLDSRSQGLFKHVFKAVLKKYILITILKTVLN